MSERFTLWDAADYLKSDEDVQAYLDACIEEDAGDGKTIAACLGAIARAHNVAQVAREAGISREGLYKALSGDGNPSFATILKVAHALGLRLRIEAAGRGERAA